MATPAQIDEQIRLEREAIRSGIEKLHKNTERLAQREYSSASVTSCASIDVAQEQVAAAILSTFRDHILKGRNGQNFAEIKHYLIQFNTDEDSHLLANLALKKTFDLVFSQKVNKKGRDPNTVNNVTVGIGQAVEAECQMRWYEEQDPDLMKKIKRKYWLTTTGVVQKQSVARLMMNRNEIHWSKWPLPVCSRLGGWLLDLVATQTGWFEKTSTFYGKGAEAALVTPTDAYLMVQEQLMEQAELFAPMHWPMLVEPNPWTNEQAGGYLLNEVMVGNPMVRNGDPTVIQGKAPLAFLNKLQRVAYTINSFVYDVAEEMDRRGYVIGKFKPLSHAIHWPEVPTPPDIDTNEEAKFKYRKDVTDSKNARKKFERQLHVKTTETMKVARKFAGMEKFYLPWSFDYRGRAYPIPAFLNVQDTEFGKSLLKFHEPAFVTYESEDWLRFQVATTYGLDKKTMAERLQWARDNENLIHQIATDPLGTICEWEVADEPWQFLAACEEMNAVLIDCTRQATNLPIAVDATCSGLQILAGLARDRGTAELVNVVPADKPQDAYRSVLEEMWDDIPERLKPFCDRSVPKRSVMTIPYNATEQSSRDYITEAIHDNMPKDSLGRVPYEQCLTPDEKTLMAKALRRAFSRIAPGPLKVMDWIKKEMGAAIKRGCQSISWTTPSGFVVTQRKDNWTTKRLDLKLMGGCKYSICDKPTGPNARKHQSSGAPNLIHSLDASLLHLAFQRFDAPFSVIHDSVLCRAQDMAILSSLVRETYMHLFAENDYLKDFAQQIGAETEPPIIGTLEPESVIESTYFFC